MLLERGDPRASLHIATRAGTPLASGAAVLRPRSEGAGADAMLTGTRPLRFGIFLYCRLVQLQAHARLVQQRQAAVPGDRRLEVEHLIDTFPEQVKLGQPAIGHA